MTLKLKNVFGWLVFQRAAILDFHRVNKAPKRAVLHLSQTIFQKLQQ